MRLGDLLVANGLVSPAQLDLALAEQRRTGRLLGHILVDQGLVTEEDIGRSIAAQFALDFVDLDPATIDPTAVMAVPEAVMRKHEALPVAWAPDGALLVAMANPTDVYALDDIRNAVNRPVTAVVVTPSALLDAVRRARRFDVVTPPSGGAATTAVGGGSATATAVATRLRIDEAGGTGAEDAPIVRLVNRLVAQAVAERASDIHLEPTEHDLRIRFRIDGVLHEVMRQPKSAQPGIISRVKVMAEIDIAERRLPQDGRVSLEVDGRAVDLRVATLPTVHGEKIVIRILDTSRALVGLNDLGFLPDTLAHLRAACANPWGAVLVTGPTGSGKSTTLYAALAELNGDDRNIITVEDPVEYRLAGANQVQVNESAGLTFSTALRSILRCDPDTVLIGEIRDRETATIAVEAALTGHLVLSTLHTNDAPGTPSRLLEMGVEPFLVTSALSCVLAQRLARRLCDRCKEPYEPSLGELTRAGWPSDWSSSGIADGDDDAPPVFHRAVGCASCGQTGYRGRFAIHELMTFSEAIGQLVIERRASDEIRRAAVANGMRTLREDGLRKVAAGFTTVEELLRVVV
jgi:type IV pilus assembly protein PilB